MSRFKRPVAGIMAALLLHSAVLPSSLFAATADIPEVPVAPTYVLELLRPDGSVEQTMARGWSEPLLARADRLHGIDAVAIDSLRKELEGIASQAKVGGSMIPTMLRILDALSAPSSEEYHRRIASLPVSISEVESIRDGQLGITKTFSARGVVRARTFRPHSSVRSDDSAVKCSYADSEDSWTGECATQREIDAAIAQMVALESDANTTKSSVTSDSSFYCNSMYGMNDTYCNAIDESSAFQGGPAAGCAGEGIMYATAIATWGWNLWRFSAAAHAVAPPAGAITDLLFGGVLAAAAVVGSGIALHDCLME